MPGPTVHKLSSHEFFEVSVVNVYSDFFFQGPTQAPYVHQLCSLFAICTSPIMHFVCPPKFFSWVLQSYQEKLKATLMQNFGGQTRCIMGDVQMGNYKSLSCNRQLRGSSSAALHW